MNLLKDVQLTFKALGGQEYLYDDVDIHAISIVDAQYDKRAGYEGIPEICALPKLKSNAELISATTVGLAEYNPEAIVNMKGYEKKENLLLLQKAYHPLGHVFEIAQAVNTALITSYMARETRCSERKEADALHSSGKILSVRNGTVGRACSFMVVGSTGCGKSVSINQIVNLYPRAIRHTFESYEYVQIPILMVAAMVGNMAELIMTLASKIDEILDMGTYHADCVRSKNVGMKCNVLKGWIKMYHIGLLIIDEVQFMNFGTGSSSFENLVAIAEETGCALGLVGNPEVNEKIHKYPRLVNRVMVNRIDIGFSDEKDRRFFEEALKFLWKYQWTKERTELTNGIMNELIHDSMYNISILKALLIRIQYEAVKKFPVDGITVEYIHKIAEREFSEIRALISENIHGAEEKILALYKKQADEIQREAKTEGQKDCLQALEQSQSCQFRAENEWKMMPINAMLSHKGYTETQIKRAMRMAIEKNVYLQDWDVPEIVNAVHDILSSGKPDTVAKVPKKKTVDIDAEQAVRAAMHTEIHKREGETA